MDVLIAEDEPHIVELLRFILGREGCETRAAGDGAAALAAARERRPDVLILDLMLPVMDGFEVLRAIRADADLRGLPVLMLTAKGQERDRLEAEAIGVDAFVTKPFANREVLDGVRRLGRGAADRDAPDRNGMDGNG